MLFRSHWEPLGETDVNNGVTTDTEHLYLATDLTPAPMEHDPEEQITVRWVPFARALEMALGGEFPECCTALAILKVGMMRKRRGNVLKSRRPGSIVSNLP